MSRESKFGLRQDPFVANLVSWKRHGLGHYVESTVERAQVLVVIYTPARSATWSFQRDATVGG